MLSSRRLGLFALAIVGLGVSLVCCDNGARGVEACRQIEAKKCEGAVGCPNAPRLLDEDDVVACRLLYRDQCLYGIADAVEPSEGELQACLVAIDHAVACKGKTMASCAAPPELAEGQEADLVSGCDAVLAPERLADCAFLAPAPASAAGGGGQGGAAGGNGATGGG